MAIYSLHHSTVGRATQAQPGTAGAHIRYITREGAAGVVMAGHMPEERNAARSWMDGQEAADRKNARVIDKVMVAIPVELDAAQRVELVRDFVADVTGGRTPWMAAIHDRNEDAHNPHAHIIIRDRDIETGKRAIGLSEKGSTERLRESWEMAANRALERAGLDVRIDRRSLEAQGIAREPGIHVGPNVYELEAKGRRPVSIAMEINGRVVNWPEIDQGRTRADRQREIEAANDLGPEKDGHRGKDGEIAAGLTPTSTTPDAVPDPQEVRRAWARMLKTLDVELSQPEPQAPATPDPAEARRGWAQQLRDLAGDTPARNASKLRLDPDDAPRRPYQPEQAVAQEKSRLSAAIERGWEKLTGLANRMEAAFQRILNRQQSTPDIERPTPEREPPRRPHDVEIEEVEMQPSPAMEPPPAPPPPPPPPPPHNRHDGPQFSPGYPAQPSLTPAQGLGKSLNHPLLRRRRRLDGPSLP